MKIYETRFSLSFVPFQFTLLATTNINQLENTKDAYQQKKRKSYVIFD